MNKKISLTTDFLNEMVGMENKVLPFILSVLICCGVVLLFFSFVIMGQLEGDKRKTILVLVVGSILLVGGCLPFVPIPWRLLLLVGSNCVIGFRLLSLLELYREGLDL